MIAFHIWEITRKTLQPLRLQGFVDKDTYLLEESAEAPPVAGGARGFRGSVPIGGHEQ